jgi:hypothetical protein
MTIEMRFRETLPQMKSKYALIVALAISLLVGCATPSHRASAWEYKILEGKVFGSEKRLDTAINQHVADGWEFFSPIHYGNEDWGFILLRRSKK